MAGIYHHETMHESDCWGIPFCRTQPPQQSMSLLPTWCMLQGREPLFVPCTPLGCIELLERTNTPIAGKQAVVIGRSNIVGMPVALLLIKRNATVTVCHSATQNMEQVVRAADIVIAAAGQAEMIKVSSVDTTTC